MSCVPGKVIVEDVAEINDEKVFVLKFTQRVAIPNGPTKPFLPSSTRARRGSTTSPPRSARRLSSSSLSWCGGEAVELHRRRKASGNFGGRLADLRDQMRQR